MDRDSSIALSPPIVTPRGTLGFSPRGPRSLRRWMDAATTQLHHVHDDHGCVASRCVWPGCPGADSALAFLDELAALGRLSARLQHLPASGRRAAVVSELLFGTSRRLGLFDVLLDPTDHRWRQRRAAGERVARAAVVDDEAWSARLWLTTWEWFALRQIELARAPGQRVRMPYPPLGTRREPVPARVRPDGPGEPELQRVVLDGAREALQAVTTDLPLVLTGRRVAYYDESRRWLSADFHPPSDLKRARVAAGLRAIVLGTSGPVMTLFDGLDVRGGGDAVEPAIRGVVRAALARIDPAAAGASGARDVLDQAVHRTSLSVFYVLEQVFAARGGEDPADPRLAARATMTAALVTTGRQGDGRGG